MYDNFTLLPGPQKTETSNAAPPPEGETVTKVKCHRLLQEGRALGNIFDDIFTLSQTLQLYAGKKAHILALGGLDV